MTAKSKKFRGVVVAGNQGAGSIAIPFDPDEVWGEKPRHHVTGTVNGVRVRGPLVRTGTTFVLSLGPAWLKDGGLSAGETAKVELAPEGPQRDGLDPDVAAALDANPAAAEFFDGLAQFYRKGYLTWIAGTKKRPEERAARIAKTVELLAAGEKVRPRK